MGITSWILGAIYYNLSSTDDKWFVYIGSQFTLVFLFQFVLISLVYKKVFNRIPEISRAPSKNIDIIPTIIINMGIVLIPLLLDIYFIKFVINK